MAGRDRIIVPEIKRQPPEMTLGEAATHQALPRNPISVNCITPPRSLNWGLFTINEVKESVEILEQ